MYNYWRNRVFMGRHKKKAGACRYIVIGLSGIPIPLSTITNDSSRHYCIFEIIQQREHEVCYSS